jgi:hypothetical protein
MVGNREIPSSARLWLLTLLAGASACTSVLGIEDLHEGPRAAAGSENGGGTDASASGKSSGAGSNNGGATNDGGASNNGGNSAAGSGNSTNAGSGGASGTGTGGTAPVEGTVHGKVIDLWGRALPNVLIQVADKTGATDTKGEFSFDDVPAEYDASLYVTIANPGADYGWVYQGVTRRDPTFQVYNAREGRETPVPVNSVNGPYPLAATDKVAYSIALADGVESGTLGTMAGVEVRPEWFGSSTTMGTAHAISWSFNAATQAPTKYSAYDSKLIALKEGTKGDTITFDLAPTTIETKPIEGTVAPVGQGDRVNHLFARFESHGTIELMSQDDAPDTFSYLVPTLPQGSIMFAASEGDEYEGPFAIAHADGLNGGDKNVKLSIPAPALPLQPTGAAGEGIPKDQVFKFQPGTGNDGPFLIWIERGDRSGYAMYIVTAKTQFTIPEVVSGAFDLDKVLDESSYYRWGVTTHGDYAGIDDMLGPNGFLDVFGVLTGIPIGPHQTSGSYTKSATYDFTKAP